MNKTSSKIYNKHNMGEKGNADGAAETEKQGDASWNNTSITNTTRKSIKGKRTKTAEY